MSTYYSTELPRNYEDADERSETGPTHHSFGKKYLSIIGGAALLITAGLVAYSNSSLGISQSTNDPLVDKTISFATKTSTDMSSGWYGDKKNGDKYFHDCSNLGGLSQFDGKGTDSQVTQLYLACSNSDSINVHFGNNDDFDSDEPRTYNANCPNMYDGLKIYYTEDKIVKLRPICSGTDQKSIGSGNSKKYDDFLTFNCLSGAIGKLDFTFNDPFFGKTHMTSIKVSCYDSPTAKPSPIPTAKPSANPTFSPTLTPTVKPSVEPSANPTDSPTVPPKARVCPLGAHVKNPVLDEGCVVIDQHADDMILYPGQKWMSFKICASANSGPVQLNVDQLNEYQFTDLKGVHSFANSTVSIISSVYLGEKASIDLYKGKYFDQQTLTLPGQKGKYLLRDFTYDNNVPANNNVYSLIVRSTSQKVADCE